MMLAISLAILRIRPVSQEGAFPPCNGRFATPVRYMLIMGLMDKLGIYGLLQPKHQIGSNAKKP
jgi:hypothetical protein